MLGPEIQFVDRDYIQHDGKRLLYLAGIDYHRMSSNPLVIQSAAEAALKFGLSATGSRTTTGNHKLFVQLERAVAEFFEAEESIVLASGYMSNITILQALDDEYDTIFIDDKAHSSLCDAAKLSGKEIYRFVNLDPQSLADQIKEHLQPKASFLVLTDGVFPARGEIAPLKEYLEIVKNYGGRLLVDDAHAMAVTGETGKGTWEEQGVGREMIYQSGTLSKGFGAAGGVIQVGRELAVKIRDKSPAFIGSTGLALPIAAAALKSVSYITSHRQIITDLQKRALAMKHRFNKIGISMPDNSVPIFSITFNDVKKNNQLQKRLIERGVYPPYINYPGGPPGGHFRFILTSGTTEEQENMLFEAIVSSL